ncbi:MAG: hypothetical protein P5683_22410 [Limnospira sp. PMC 1279.21]|nr:MULTISPECIES: hypothetical protein [unclassified Limnospira]MDT9211072.1 hypothetical protein [Limnospira sp. PMC 1252.20]MDT9226372.1 hypothetical protein [Limnospira sp. PMC 1279.21]MDT9246674.1 hypothetical protein [Limnospira sp. PMC 1249.20]
MSLVSGVPKVNEFNLCSHQVALKGRGFQPIFSDKAMTTKTLAIADPTC